MLRGTRVFGSPRSSPTNRSSARFFSSSFVLLAPRGGVTVLGLKPLTFTRPLGRNGSARYEVANRLLELVTFSERSTLAGPGLEGSRERNTELMSSWLLEVIPLVGFLPLPRSSTDDTLLAVGRRFSLCLKITSVGLRSLRPSSSVDTAPSSVVNPVVYPFTYGPLVRF